MEINENLIAKLKSQAEELDNNAYLYGIVPAINALLERSTEDKVYFIRVKGKELYSFMSEEEMYQIMFGMSKDEYIQEKEQRKKELEEDKASNKAEAEEVLKTKFPKYKKIYEESFPKGKSQKYIAFVEDELKSGNIYVFRSFEEKVKLLEAARTKPAREVEKLYYEETDSQTRLYYFQDLINSFYADVFMNMLLDDFLKFKNNDGKLSESEIDEIILDYAKAVREAKALAVEAFKKQDVKSVLRSRIQKPIEASRKIAASKTSNNLDVLLGDESNEKGKTQRGSQKD